MKYKKCSRQEKIEIVEAINSGMTISDVSRIVGIHPNTISYWLTKEDLNPNAECVRIRNERKRLAGPEPKNPFPEGVEMAGSKDPQELERENRDLRRKNAYLEDKVAYLEALYEIITESPDTVSKKNDAWQSPGSSGKDTPT